MGNLEVNNHYKKSKPKHDERLNMRLKEDELKELDKLAEKKKLNRSEVIRKLISNAAKPKKKYAGYECYSCDQKIAKGETYYCELKDLEKQDDLEGELEIDVIESIPTQILCNKCATKKGKLKIFKENNSQGLKTKESFR